VKRSTLFVAVMAGLLVAVMVAAGCGSSGGGGSTTTPTTPIVGPITGESIQAYAGTDFQVTLASNPTTGFTWSITTPPDNKVVTEKGSTFIAPPTGSNAVVGAGGQEVWTFHAVAPGNTTMVFANQRAEAGTPPAQTHSVSVLVVAAPTKPVSKPKTYTNAKTPIKETAGREFLIDIPEQTASTGFKWLLSSGYNHKVTVFEGVTFIKATGSQLGTAQTEVWRFLAVGKGTTKLTFSYVQPFDKTAPPAQTLVFTVTVN